MQIQKTGMAIQLPNTVTKKENDPKEQVIFGSGEATPEFLKPLANQTAAYSDISGGTVVGKTIATTLLSGALGSVEGAVCAGIGWGVTLMTGNIGGAVATGALGAIGFMLRSGEQKGNLLMSATSGALYASSAWMGVTHGATGIIYGAAITGLPSALTGAAAGVYAGIKIAEEKRETEMNYKYLSNMGHI